MIGSLLYVMVRLGFIHTKQEKGLRQDHQLDPISGSIKEESLVTCILGYWVNSGRMVG